MHEACFFFFMGQKRKSLLHTETIGEVIPLWFEHIIVILALIGFPLFSAFMLKRLKLLADSSSIKKRRVYLLTSMMNLGLTGLILLCIPWNDVFYLEHDWATGIVPNLYIALVLLYVALTMLAPIGLLRKEEYRKAFLEDYSQKTHVYPTRNLERLLFLGVAICVGIGEEVIFRSFLPHYFHDTLGITSPFYSYIVAAVLFGLGHYHQGWKGVPSQIVTALLLSLLFYLSGSLWLPILVHIVLDAKIVVVSRYWLTHNTHNRNNQQKKRAAF